MRRLPRIAGILLILALPLLALQVPPVRDALLVLVEQVRDGGWPGVALYVAIYTLGGLVTAPVGVLSGIAGYAYGPLLGVCIASPANVLAATAAFVVGRALARDWLTRRVSKNARWALIDRAVAKDAFRVTLLLRLTPLVPQNFLSYALAVTRVPVHVFAAATMIGIFPATVVQVYAGSLVRGASALFEGADLPGPLRWVVPVLAVVLTLVIAIIMTRAARRALDRTLAEAGAPLAPAPPAAPMTGEDR